MPRKVRQLVADLEAAGFALAPGGKGSHRKFRHPLFAGRNFSVAKTVLTRSFIRRSKSATPSAQRPDES